MLFFVVALIALCSFQFGLVRLRVNGGKFSKILPMWLFLLKFFYSYNSTTLKNSTMVLKVL